MTVVSRLAAWPSRMLCCLWRAAAVLVVCALLGSCLSSGERVVHGEGKGPLSASRGGGGQALIPLWDPRMKNIDWSTHLAISTRTRLAIHEVGSIVIAIRFAMFSALPCLCKFR